MKLGQTDQAMEFEAISTGSLGLDIALGIGGLPRGRVVEIFGPESSGLSNEGLKASINDFIDRMIEFQEDETIWDYFSYLLPISVAFVVHELFKRYKKGEITKKQFRNLTIKATGIKASKFAAIFLLLSIPVVNVVTCIALLTKLIKDIRNTAENLMNKKGEKNSIS